MGAQRGGTWKANRRALLCSGRLSLGPCAALLCDQPALFLQVKKHMQDLSSRISRARHNEL